MSTRPARSAYDPTLAVARRPRTIVRAQAMPPAARRRGLLLALALGLLASVAHPGRAHAQQMMRVGYTPANAAAAPAQAATTIQGPTAIQMQIQQQLQSQLDILNGTADGGGSRASVEVGPVDPRVANQPCDQVELMLPSANRLRGRIQVGVRCRSPHAWAAWVPATIQISGTYYVAARQLPPGKTLDMSDLEARTGDLSALPPSVVLQPADAVGRVLLTSLAPNQPLRAESLRMPIAIQAGQTVKLVADGGGFQVTSDGRALNQAAIGQVAQVRTANGNVISGIAQSPGVVAVQF
ncbi:flagellar basal body P-ring formation chaperone FlgA (plasmid) [Ralstonia solanacearum P673]|uniref:flagellar basal body P-ring formation chaperone FlgA n=1 Tax=Ralstonia solanacearum TaxID=305 RepID=UPI0004B59AB1|nr:flagellar basal body P-ring formation chaperone FlgA [Ralstonia solanacearum]MCL9851036.1 flagellar basal body P-ring formation protein FlgA [Ralstonia solanacearum]MCL9856733.1 flagellar basal body P-ring formation protein FlgA [Ralstonia solanacearum]MCL9860589.1 flagellar basal body P-ring formation protein FlgA [Ralstonia solanacearum]MCL9866360.1 flagellar basal body P-ring formation protein FlgA [Ralstonia solanacearum]MCL9871109.1 flagellar basal body P-ring formation protein FlgA [R